MNKISKEKAQEKEKIYGLDKEKIEKLIKDTTLFEPEEKKEIRTALYRYSGAEITDCYNDFDNFRVKYQKDLAFFVAISYIAQYEKYLKRIHEKVISLSKQ